MATPTEIKPIQLGDAAPNFVAQTTEGPIDFYGWMRDSWAVLFSHPRDFTPVCTTELGEVARLMGEFKKRNVRVIALSMDGLVAHRDWIQDINETQHTAVNFPLIADEGQEVARLYGMMHPLASDTFTVRTVFIIDPKKKVRLTMTYPASTGRNFQEILRVIDSLQLTDKHSVATPVNWRQGEDCVILPFIRDPEDLKKKFPKGWTEVKPYLRLTPPPSDN